MEEVIQTTIKVMEKLLLLGKVIVPFVVSPYGRWGGMFHKLLFGQSSTLELRFRSCVKAWEMYEQATPFPTPSTLVRLATAHWQKGKPRHQHFYNHPRMVPTQKSEHHSSLV